MLFWNIYYRTLNLYAHSMGSIDFLHDAYHCKAKRNRTFFIGNAARLPLLAPDQVLKLKQLTILTLAETNKVFFWTFTSFMISCNMEFIFPPESRTACYNKVKVYFMSQNFNSKVIFWSAELKFKANCELVLHLFFASLHFLFLDPFWNSLACNCNHMIIIV